VLSGLPRARLVAARLVTGAVLAALATTASLVALAARTGGIDSPWRVAAGTFMSAGVYLGLGAVVGVLVPNAVNGTVILMFAWILDVFFGPTLSGSTSPILRVLPTHFISLWTVGLPTGHAGVGPLAGSLVWIGVAFLVSWSVVAGAAGRRAAMRDDRVGAAVQLRTGLRMGWHDWKRTPVLWALLAIVPAVFVLLSDAVTPHGRTPVTLREGGRTFTAQLDPAHIHAGTMAPIATASLAALVGVFIVLDAGAADGRLALAGQRPTVLLATRLIMVLAAAAMAGLASLTVTATVFNAHQWDVYIGANALLAMTYALIGVIVGRFFGRVSGVFMAFLLPFLDLGIAQSPMLREQPAPWAHWLPGFGGTRVMLDGALTSGFDESVSLAVAVGWVVALVALAAWVILRGIPLSGHPKPGLGTEPRLSQPT
jgi:hypothetical protein